MNAHASDRPRNRLAAETSPYLLQHAHNPVDWHPWGEDAFAKARAADRPILLSVGYATCHWCHVMERESFEDEAIARQLAEGFVAIKVDREELPDVDAFYMRALQAMGQRGGWPMNMFLTPQLLPFFGGTYFPPQPRYGMSSLSQVLAAVSEAWRTRRGEIEAQGQALLEHLRAEGEGEGPERGAGRAAGGAPVVRAAFPAAAGETGEPADAMAPHERAGANMARAFDWDHGGFGSAPKFPNTPLLQYLLSLAALGDDGARPMLLAALERMAAGGIFDHVGGGFARYSTDERWHVPHFEKMLYDNAQLVRAYAGAWALSGDERLRLVAEGTIGWMLREMRPAEAPAAFGSAYDADSEGEEGRFHVWTLAQFREALGDDAQAAALLYDVRAEGNWEHGRNVLQRLDPAQAMAATGLSGEAFDAWERGVRERLYAARAKRVWPLFDDKVLADWNGMALRALAEAGRLFGRPDWVRDARALAEFLLGTMVAGGRLRHAWRNGVLRAESYLADHAQAGLGMLELHAATGEARWLRAAHDLCEEMAARFVDPALGFLDAEAGALPLRTRDRYDGAVPSGAAAACELLLRLAGPFDRADWRELALDTIERDAALTEESPLAAPAMLHARLVATHGAELAVPAGEGSDALAAAARSAFAPLVTPVFGAPDEAPLLAGRRAGEAYLCRHGACGLPARSAGELAAQLAEHASGRG